MNLRKDHAAFKKAASRLIATHDPRIFYLPIPKCACTFIKNVLWFIEHRTFHENPIRIHDYENLFTRASAVANSYSEVAEAPLAFTVLRNPIDRLTSLYFDKVIGSGRSKFVPLYQTLLDKHRLISVPVQLSDHQYNLEVLVDWIEANLSSGVDLPKEAHWTPQSHRRDVMRRFNLCLLTVDNLSSQLIALLSGSIPNIQSILSEAEANASKKPARRSDLLSSEIRHRINLIYSDDRRLYRRTKQLWSEFDQDGLTARIPRFCNIEDGRNTVSRNGP